VTEEELLEQLAANRAIRSLRRPRSARQAPRRRPAPGPPHASARGPSGGATRLAAGLAAGLGAQVQALAWSAAGRRSRPLGGLACLVIATRSGDLVTVAVALIGLVPAAISYLVDNGGLRGILGRCWGSAPVAAEAPTGPSTDAVAPARRRLGMWASSRSEAVTRPST
jgi:hypothetical protein